ncbi:MAG: hypothetical protein ABIJ57_03640 [Pseudomonadota bacterium]
MVDAVIKFRFLKIVVVKRHVVDEIDLEGHVAITSQDPDEIVRGGSGLEFNQAPAQGLQGLFDLIPEIGRLIDEKIEVVRIAVMEVMTAERLPPVR